MTGSHMCKLLSNFLFLMNPSWHVGLSRLGLQLILFQSKISFQRPPVLAFFSPLPHIVTVMWFVSSLWFSTVPRSCTHCPGGVRAQREDNGGIWTLILLLTLPIILCYCCTCSPIALPLLLCHPSSPLTLLLLVFFAPNYVLFRSQKTTDPIAPSSLSYFFSSLFFFLKNKGTILRTRKCTLEETFHGQSKEEKLLRPLCDICWNTLVTRSEELPLFRHQVVRQKKALRWVWQIRGGEVTLLAQRWWRSGYVCLLVLVCLWVFYVQVGSL